MNILAINKKMSPNNNISPINFGDANFSKLLERVNKNNPDFKFKQFISRINRHLEQNIQQNNYILCSSDQDYNSIKDFFVKTYKPESLIANPKYYYGQFTEAINNKAIKLDKDKNMLLIENFDQVLYSTPNAPISQPLTHTFSQNLSEDVAKFNPDLQEKGIIGITLINTSKSLLAENQLLSLISQDQHKGMQFWF